MPRIGSWKLVPAVHARAVGRMIVMWAPTRIGLRIGTLSPGTPEFFREIFDASGGLVSMSTLGSAWKQRELELAAHAVVLITAGLRRTTQIEPYIVVRSLDDGVTAVTYNGAVWYCCAGTHAASLIDALPPR